MNTVSLSIIIPCYNTAFYCDQLSKTIGKQLIGGGKNIEFILVDDGSKDNTLACIREIQSKYPEYVKVISKPNGGVSSARNEGMKKASSEWIGFLDSDDVYAPGGLQYLLDNCTNSKADIIQFEYKTVAAIPSTFEPFTNNILHEGCAKEYYTGMNALTVWRFLYRRSYLEDNNICFRDMRIAEDGLFNFNACMAGGKIRCVDTVVTYHLDREGSLTTSINKDYVRKIIESVMIAQSVFADYLANNETTTELQKRIKMHQERQIRFVFSKIRVTSDFSISEIKSTSASFTQYQAFPFKNAKGQDKLINYLYNHPIVFKLYIKIYSFLRRLKHGH